MTVTTAERPYVPPKFANTVISWLLHSPLHGLFSNNLMLLTFTGRKSGKSYTTPVGYMLRNHEIFVFTDHQWWKNLRNNAPVTMYVQGKTLRGTAEAIPDDKTATEEELYTFLLQHPLATRAYAIKLDEHKQPIREDVRKAAQVFTMIHIHIV